MGTIPIRRELNFYQTPDKYMIINPYVFGGGGLPGDPFPLAGNSMILVDPVTYYDAGTGVWTDISGSTRDATVTSAPVDNGSYLSFPTGNESFNFSRITNLRSMLWVLRVNSPNPSNAFLLGDSSTFPLSSVSTTAWLDSTFSDTNARSGSLTVNGSASSPTATRTLDQWVVVTLVTIANIAASQLSQDRTFGRSLTNMDLKCCVLSPNVWDSTDVAAAVAWAKSEHSIP